MVRTIVTVPLLTCRADGSIEIGVAPIAADALTTIVAAATAVMSRPRAIWSPSPCARNVAFVRLGQQGRYAGPGQGTLTRWR